MTYRFCPGCGAKFKPEGPFPLFGPIQLDVPVTAPGNRGLHCFECHGTFPIGDKDAEESYAYYAGIKPGRIIHTHCGYCQCPACRAGLKQPLPDKRLAELNVREAFTYRFCPGCSARLVHPPTLGTGHDLTELLCPKCARNMIHKYC